MRYLTIVYAVPDSFDVRQLTAHELVSAMSWCHAIDEKNRLGNGVIESRDSVRIGQTGNAQAKPENSDMDSVCHDIAPSPNAVLSGKPQHTEL